MTSSRCAQNYFAVHQHHENIDDLYRPCGVIDHPENLRNAVFESRDKGEKVKASFETGENTITKLAPEIDRLAKEREEKVGAKWNNGEL